MFPDKEKTYPGRQFIQILQAGLVLAIIAFTLSALRPSPAEPTDPLFEPSPTTVPVATALPDKRVAVDELYTRGRIAHDVRDYEKAIDIYTQVIELDPTTADVWLSRGVAYEQAGADERLSRNDLWRYVQRMETERLERKIVPNKTLTLRMTEGLVYALSFEADKGDKLKISATSTVAGRNGDDNVVDPLALLFDPNDNLVRGDDDTLRTNGTLISMDSRIEDYRVPEDGTYTLLITHAGGGSYGTVSVLLNVR